MQYISRSILIVIMMTASCPSWAENLAAVIEPRTELSPSNTTGDSGAGASTTDPAGKSKLAALTNNNTEISDAAVVDTLALKDMDMMDVLQLLSEKSGLNIIAGQAISGRVTIFLNNVKLKDVLQIILDANGLAYAVEEGVVRVMPAADFERRYGHPFGGNIQTRIVSLVYSDATAMSALLNQIKSTAGKITFDPGSNTMILMDSPSQILLMEQLIRQIDVPVMTRVFELSYARAVDLAPKIEGTMLSKSGSVRFDERSNKLIVADTQSKIDLIAKFVTALDVKQQQVLIEAKIVQIVLSNQNKLGIDWEAVVSKYHDLDIKSKFNILSGGEKRGTMSVGTLSSDNYTALVEALNTVGSTDILSSPRITTINGQEAKILVGSTEPYVTSTTTTPASGPTSIAESVNFIDVGVKLYVTPHIHKDDFITMKIKPEVSSVTRTLTTSNNNTIPVVDTSEAETTVTVKNGITIVIGGLIKDENILTKNKVPILGDIPVLGHAFRNSDDQKRKTEIVVFLTPRIITGDVPVVQEPQATK